MINSSFWSDTVAPPLINQPIWPRCWRRAKISGPLFTGPRLLTQNTHRSSVQNTCWYINYSGLEYDSGDQNNPTTSNNGESPKEPTRIQWHGNGGDFEHFSYVVAFHPQRRALSSANIMGCFSWTGKQRVLQRGSWFCCCASRNWLRPKMWAQKIGCRF